MIFKICIALFSVGIPLLLTFLLRKFTKLHPEITRKVAHIGASIGISVAPFYLPWETVRALALALFVIVALALYFKWGQEMYTVRRKTYGEILFPLAIIGVSLFAPSPAVFCVAVLHLGLADGMAAVIGTMRGKNNSYRILGGKKSRIGTLTFFMVSLLLLVSFNMWANDPVSWGIVALLPFAATFFENIGLRGTDNITVPMLIVIALGTF